MYFIKLEVMSSAALYQLALKEPSISPYLSDIYNHAVMIMSAERANEKLTLNRTLYLTNLKSRLKRNLSDALTQHVLTLTEIIFDEIGQQLDETAKVHECVPVTYKLYRKDRTSFFITRLGKL